MRLLAFACALLLWGCLPPDPDPGGGVARAESLRIRFPATNSLNVKLDSLVLSTVSPTDTQRTTLAPFNPALQSVKHEIIGLPGAAYSLEFLFYKTGRKVAQSSAQVVLGDSAARMEATARFERLPAWDSLIPPVAAAGRLIFLPGRLSLAEAPGASAEVKLWNRNLDTLSWSLIGSDPFVSVLPGSSLRLPPGEEMTLRISLDTALAPAARTGGLLVFTSGTLHDTLPLRYLPELAAGQGFLKGRAAGPDGARLPGTGLRISAWGDTVPLASLRCDASGEFAWIPPRPGPYRVVAAAAGRLDRIDSLVAVTGDSAEHSLTLLPVPAARVYDFSLADQPFANAAVIAGHWVAPTQSLLGEGLVAFAPEGNPTAASARNIPQGNTDGQGGIFLAQEIAGNDSALYLSYPADRRIIRIDDWRGTPAYRTLELSILPFGLAMAGGLLLAAGADSNDNTVLAIVDLARFALDTVIALPGMRSGGLDLGIWGPKVAVGASAWYVTEGGNRTGSSRIARVTPSTRAVATAALSGGIANDVTIGPGGAIYALTAEAGASYLHRFSPDLEPAFSLKLAAAGFRLSAGSAGYAGVLLVRGRKGELAWLDAARGEHLGGDAAEHESLLLWDGGTTLVYRK